jgi:hypothetical protein
MIVRFGWQTKRPTHFFGRQQLLNLLFWTMNPVPKTYEPTRTAVPMIGWKVGHSSGAKLMVVYQLLDVSLAKPQGLASPLLPRYSMRLSMVVFRNHQAGQNQKEDKLENAGVKSLSMEDILLLL